MKTYRLTRRGRIVKGMALWAVLVTCVVAFLALYALALFAWATS